jgi:import inner membrane translocase subunit TIM16
VSESRFSIQDYHHNGHTTAQLTVTDWATVKKMSKILAQLILAGSQIIGRALTRAIRQELEAAQRAASQRKQNVPPPIQTDMTLDEAMKILNVSELDPEQIEKNYKHLFEANDRKNGGSFYLQSKVFRAKERLDLEFTESKSTKRDRAL